MWLLEPPSGGRELEVRICQLNVEIPHQLDQGFVHFHYAYMPARTNPRTLTEL